MGYRKINMTTERIKKIQEKTAYPDSIGVQQALLQVWNECEPDGPKLYSEEQVFAAFRDGASRYLSFGNHKFDINDYRLRPEKDI
jgi:hypothetical protein